MTVTDPAQKPLADRAVGELAYMLAKVGRVSELGALLKSNVAWPARSGRSPRRRRSREPRAGLAEMRTRPGCHFAPARWHCTALCSRFTQRIRADLIAASESTPRGFSLLGEADE